MYKFNLVGLSRVRGICLDLSLSSSGCPASLYLLRLGTDGRQPEDQYNYQSKEISSAILSPTTLELEANPAKVKILCQTCGRLAKHGVIATASWPTPKPGVTQWNSKESPHQLPEEKCPSVVLEICALFTSFKLRCLEKDTGLHN